jgi:hypothetical protein
MMRREDCRRDCVGPDCEGCRKFVPLSSDAVLDDNFVFMAVEWLNNKPIINGSKVFKDKIKCIEYIQNLPKIDGLEWTIAKLEIVA